MHVNQQVREAARERIAGIPTIPALSIFTNRSANLTDAELPAVVIGTGTDEVGVATKDGLERREITLTVVIVADGDAYDLDDGLDALRFEIEEAMAGDLGGLATGIEHTGGELEMGTDEDGERWFAFYALSWRVEVWTEQGNPEVAT